MSEDSSPAAPSPRTCSVEGCDKPAQKKGVCWTHYRQGACSVDGCGRDARRSGKCWQHYEAGLGTCQFSGCDKPARRTGFCRSHRRQRHERHDGALSELQEPRGGGRDKAGMPRRTFMDQLEEAAIDLADYNAQGDREGYERARARLRMVSLRHGRASPERHSHNH